jgi:cysteinyl-tRNA synthetase
MGDRAMSIEEPHHPDAVEPPSPAESVAEEKPPRTGTDAAEVRALVEARIAARQIKDWAEADKIRDKLVAMGIVLMDGKNPETGEFITEWEFAR